MRISQRLVERLPFRQKKLYTKIKPGLQAEGNVCTRQGGGVCYTLLFVVCHFSVLFKHIDVI